MALPQPQAPTATGLPPNPWTTGVGPSGISDRPWLSRSDQTTEINDALAGRRWSRNAGDTRPFNMFSSSYNPMGMYTEHIGIGTGSGLSADEAASRTLMSGASYGQGVLAEEYLKRMLGGVSTGGINAANFDANPAIKSGLLAALANSQGGATGVFRPRDADVLMEMSNQNLPMVSGQYGRQQLEQALGQQQALAASGGGANRALSARLAQSATADARNQAIMGSAAMRGEEDLAQKAMSLSALKGAAGLYGDMGELAVKDIDRRNQLADALAGQLTSTEDTRLRALQMGEDQARQWYQQTLGIPTQLMQPWVDIRRAEVAAAANDNGPGVGTLLGTSAIASVPALVAMLAGSDKKLKKDVEPGAEDVRDFLDKLNAHKYKYKDPKTDGAGVRVSVMAQELKKSKIGKLGVVKTDRGLMVDYGKLLPGMLAAQADLHHRLKALGA